MITFINNSAPLAADYRQALIFVSLSMFFFDCRRQEQIRALEYEREQERRMWMEQQREAEIQREIERQRERELIQKEMDREREALRFANVVCVHKCVMGCRRRRTGRTMITFYLEKKILNWIMNHF